MSHGSHSVAHATPRDETHVWGFRLEIVIAVLLGLAAIVGAFAAYFGHVAEGHAVKEGKDDEHRSNRYTLVEVLIASSLFLYGIASVTRGYPIKLGFLALGAVLFLVSVGQLARVRWG